MSEIGPRSKSMFDKISKLSHRELPTRDPGTGGGGSGADPN